MADALSSCVSLTVLTNAVVERSRLHIASCLLLATSVDLRNFLTAEVRPGVIQMRQSRAVATDPDESARNTTRNSSATATPETSTCDIANDQPDPIVESNTDPNDSRERTSTAQSAVTACAVLTQQPDRNAQPTAFDLPDVHIDLRKEKAGLHWITMPLLRLQSCCNWMRPIRTTRLSLRWSAAHPTC